MNTPVPVYATLSHRATGDLLRALGGGTAGFDYKKYALADLRRFIAAWIAQGAMTLDHVEAHACAVIAAGNVATIPPAPIVAPAPIPAPPAPIVAAPAPVYVPQPYPVHAPAPQPVPAPIVPAAPVIPPQPAPIVAAIPAAAAYAPTSRDAHGVTLLSAREVWGDQPMVAAALPAGLMVRHYADPLAPPVNPGYYFDPATLGIALIAATATPPVPFWAAGPKGTGKTEFINQLAARLGRQVFRVGFTRATEPAEILGDMGLRDGATVWTDGPVATALRTPGAVLMLDEITYAAQGYLATLNPLLEVEGAHVRLPRTGEILHPAADVIVAAADNTLGHGDSSGEYHARNPLSADTLDRFPVKVVFSYLDADTERKVLLARVAKLTGGSTQAKLRPAVAKAILGVCHVARQRGDVGELQGAPGLRAAIAMGLLMARGVAAPAAFEACITRAAPAESHEVLRSIFAASWPAGDPDVADAPPAAPAAAPAAPFGAAAIPSQF